MADLAYKFIGVNTAQLANEVRLLRQNSSTFRALEASAVAAGYTTIEVRMGASLLKGEIADSGKVNSSTWGMRINSDASGSWGVGGRQATVGEVIAHELAHAVVPQEFREPGRIDPGESGTKGMWVRRQAGQVALDLGLPGANNADHLITRIPINETQGCTVQDTSAPAVPLAPFDDASLSGGLLGRLAVLAGIDPQDPTQPAPPPLDGQPRGFYRDGPIKPWFVQRQR
jgi:hypothetical protein